MGLDLLGISILLISGFLKVLMVEIMVLQVLGGQMELHISGMFQILVT